MKKPELFFRLFHLYFYKIQKFLKTTLPPNKIEKQCDQYWDGPEILRDVHMHPNIKAPHK